MSRIALTGIGIVSALGLDRTSHWEQVLAGQSGIRELEPDPVAPLPLTRGGAIRDFQLSAFLPDRKLARMLSAATGYAFAAATQAIADSGIDLSAIPPERRGLYCQTGMFQVEGRDLAPIVESCCDEGTLSLQRFGARGLTVINPFLPIRTLPNMGLGVLSIHFDLQGPNLVAGPFASQGAMLLDLACSALQEGDAEVCLVAGSDAPFNVMTVSSLLAMEGVPADLVLGEAGVALVLETEERARARGGTIHALIDSAEIRGGGRSRHGRGPISSEAEAALQGLPAISYQDLTGSLPGAGLLLDTAHAALSLRSAPGRVAAQSVDLSGAIGTVCLSARS